MTRRFQRVQRKGVRLTELDFEMVEAVFYARYLTNQMMVRLFFKPTTSSWCRQRVRYLYDLRYLNKRRAYMNEPDIYFLGLRGKRYIVSLGGYTKEQVDRIAGVSGGRDPAPMLMMKHELTLSRLYVNARLECQVHGWHMRWKNARMLELERLGIEPDAWIEVINEDRHRQAFIEFTAAMPTKRELSGKIERYEGYWERTGQPIPVLWLTTSRSKANRLWEGVLQSIYEDYFLVGLIEDAGHFLTKPIWRWSESEEKVRWVNPPR